MGKNENRRQKKLARTKAKHKKGHGSSGKPAAGASQAVQAERAARAPIHRCVMKRGLFTEGMGHVIVARMLPDGSIGASAFLLDVFCLGVKDVFFAVMSESRFDSIIRDLTGLGGVTTISPACARRLVEGAVAYAGDLGFRPHSDYAAASRIFGDIDPGECDTQFRYGMDGKPFYIAGPNDTQGKVKKILETLQKRVGPGGYEYSGVLPAMLADLDADDEEDDNLATIGRPGDQVPLYDYIDDSDMEDLEELEDLLYSFMESIEGGYFLTWEAVEREERGLELSREQEKALSDIYIEDEEAEGPVLTIGGFPRPSEPWYETARRILSHLIIDPIRTDEDYTDPVFDGWPNLLISLREHGRGLSLPEGAKAFEDIIPAELRHRLWLQHCFEPLMGVGNEGITLEDVDEQYRVASLIECLREQKESVRFFDLTVEKMLKMAVLPVKDEQVLATMMLDRLKLPSVKEGLADYL